MIAAVSAHLSFFDGLISGWLRDQVLLDKTGLQGRYSFTFDWQRQPGILAIDSSRLSLAAAPQNQLGLRLESTKAAVGTILIEHIEQPTEN
jgi:uncharacterized protein (TIGR03435 family)